MDATHDFTTGGNDATVTSGAALSGPAARIGASGLSIPTSSDRFEYDSTGILTDPSKGIIACFVHWVTALPGGAGGSPMQIRGTNTNDFVMLRTLSSNEIQMRISHNTGGAINIATATA